MTVQLNVAFSWKAKHVHSAGVQCTDRELHKNVHSSTVSKDTETIKSFTKNRLNKNGRLSSCEKEQLNA